MIVSLISMSSGTQKNMPPQGIMLLYTALRSSGICDLYVHDLLMQRRDYSSIGKYAEEIAANDPDIICLSVYTEYAVYAKKLIFEIKKIVSKKVRVVVGGPHPTCAPTSCVRMLEPDVVVRGAGEFVISDIIAALMSNENYIAGNCSNLSGIIIVDERDRAFRDLCSKSIMADRSCFEIGDYRFPYTVITARGCPAKCRYCASPVIHKNHYYPRPIDDVKTEIRYLKSTYRNDTLCILDDTFTCSFKRTQSICDTLSASNLKWFCESRIDTVDEERLKMMAEAGCRQIQFGVECFEKQILERIGKGITSKEIFNRVANASDLGIDVAVSLMIGLPGDTVALVKKRIQKAVDLAEAGAKAVEFGCLKPYPGTSIYENAKECGLLDCGLWWEREDVEKLIFPTNDMSVAKLEAMLLYSSYKINLESSGFGMTQVKKNA